MLTVACVLSEGPTYKEEHVERLHGQVDDFIKQPYQFVCVDDSPLPGWWAKIDLFRPDRFSDRVLYLDLDVTVTGGLDELADYPAPFVIIRDWHRIGYNSSVMAWDAGYVDNLYTEFAGSEDEMARHKGDQDYIWAKMHGEVTFPREWCRSFKNLVMTQSSFHDMRVCVFHGYPKPWDVAKWFQH